METCLSIPKPFTNLLPLLSHTDATVRVSNSKVLTTLLSVSLRHTDRNGEPPEDLKTALPTYLLYLAGLTKSNDSYLQDVAVPSYVSLFRSSYARITFWNTGDEAVEPLISILEAAAGGSSNGGSVGGSNPLGNLIQGGVGLQLLYHVLLVIWELTFEEVVAESIHPYAPSATLYLTVSHSNSFSTVNMMLFLSLLAFSALHSKKRSLALPPLSFLTLSPKPQVPIFLHCFYAMLSLSSALPPPASPRTQTSPPTLTLSSKPLKITKKA